MFFIDKTQKKANEDTKKSEEKKEHLINIALVQKNKNKNQLFGERFIYVMVFVAESKSDEQSVLKPKYEYMPVEKKITKEKIKEKMIKTGEDIKETIIKSFPLSVRHSSLAWRSGSGEFALFSVARGIAKAFVGAAAESKEVEDRTLKETLSLKMREVSYHNGTRLTFGMAKIPLTENSINRIHIDGLSDSNINPLATFGNYSKSWITSSICVMGSEEESQAHIDMFLLGHYYVKRPRLPPPQLPYTNGASTKNFFQKISISFVFGVKISDDIFEAEGVFMGVSLGHIFSNNLGIVIGKIYRRRNNDNNKTFRRRGEWAAGLTLIF